MKRSIECAVNALVILNVMMKLRKLPSVYRYTGEYLNARCKHQNLASELKEYLHVLLYIVILLCLCSRNISNSTSGFIINFVQV